MTAKKHAYSSCRMIIMSVNHSGISLNIVQGAKSNACAMALSTTSRDGTLLDQNKFANVVTRSLSRHAERSDSLQSRPPFRGLLRREYSVVSPRPSTPPPIGRAHSPRPGGLLTRTTLGASFQLHHGTGDLITKTGLASWGGSSRRRCSPRRPSAAAEPAFSSWPSSSSCSALSGIAASESLHETRLCSGACCSPSTTHGLICRDMSCSGRSGNGSTAGMSTGFSS